MTTILSSRKRKKIIGVVEIGGGGGGLSLACEDFGRTFDHSFSASAFFFVEVEIIPLLIPGFVNSGLVAVAECFVTSYV